MAEHHLPEFDALRDFKAAFDYVKLCERHAAMGVQWQPIETAPVGQSVLIYIPNADHYGEGIYRALLIESEWMTLEDGTHPRHWHTTGLHHGHDCLSQLPTHWMPLPKTPPLSECCNVPVTFTYDGPLCGNCNKWTTTITR